MYEPTWGAYSNVNTPQFHLDGSGPGFTPHEVAVIDEVWQRVSEIYSPFNINVTTAAPADLSHGHTQIVAIGGSYNDWFHRAAGGISYVGSFTNPSLPNVSHVFVDGTAGVAPIYRHRGRPRSRPRLRPEPPEYFRRLGECAPGIQPRQQRHRRPSWAWPTARPAPCGGSGLPTRATAPAIQDDEAVIAGANQWLRLSARLFRPSPSRRQRR